MKKPAVTAREIKAFERDGVVCLRSCFDDVWLVRLRRAFERIIVARRSTGWDGTFLTDGYWAGRDADIRAFVFEAGAAEIAMNIMRSETARYLCDQVFIKEPGAEAPTPWHNDQPYWPVTGTQGCSIWIPLDRVDDTSGGLRYVKGSHLWNRSFRPVAFTEPGRRIFEKARGETMPDIDANPADHELLSWDMQAGDCLVHSGYTVHGAKGNATRSRRRRALSIRWIGDDARYRRPRSAQDPMLVDATLRDGDRMHSIKFPLVATRSGYPKLP